MTILVVEDDENKRERVVQSIRDLAPGASIVTARSLRSGLEQVIGGQFDLIFMDMTMPTYDISTEEDGGRFQAYAGREILRQMDRRGIRAPVVICTQYDSFGEGNERLTVIELDEQLRRSHSGNYRGFIFYSASAEAWKEHLARYLKEGSK